MTTVYSLQCFSVQLVHYHHHVLYTIAKTPPPVSRPNDFTNEHILASVLTVTGLLCNCISSFGFCSASSTPSLISPTWMRLNGNLKFLLTLSAMYQMSLSCFFNIMCCDNDCGLLCLYELCEMMPYPVAKKTDVN